MQKEILILANCSVIKLREYSQSYGQPETIKVPYVKVYDKEIVLLTESGNHYRTMRKGAKLLIDYSGIQITERAFKMRTNKVKREIEAKAKVKAEQDRLTQEANNRAAKQFLFLWENMLKQTPERCKRYLAETKTRPSNSSRSGNWRNWLRMKAAKHINNGHFDLPVSSPDLLNSLNIVYNQIK